jgi:hypothetical protein
MEKETRLDHPKIQGPPQRAWWRAETWCELLGNLCPSSQLVYCQTYHDT